MPVGTSKSCSRSTSCFLIEARLGKQQLRLQESGFYERLVSDQRFYTSPRIPFCRRRFHRSITQRRMSGGEICSVLTLFVRLLVVVRERTEQRFIT
ncbi:hypothetical protein CDAR_240801 [Caerostris darwini]|uniref:Uncharacterized protein n=1 Tax=Caerostris darwini TaxID=1538125 RepID=A0AAV4UAB7_9ARAC|nr:hypothetical protein CDAR_240801 [Caerostris darwini]